MFFQFPGQEIKGADYGDRCYVVTWIVFFVTVETGKFWEQEYLRCLLEQYTILGLIIF